jgi:type I restriction enzyme S subunit
MNVSTNGQIDRTPMKFVASDIGRPDVRLQKGDVLFNNTNSPELVGKTALFDDDDNPAFSNHMTRLRSDTSRLDPAYLALRLHHAWREGWFEEHCNNHVSQASIGRDVLKTFQIAVPPIEVQRSIVSLNDAIGTRRSSAATHLDACRRNLDRFRQSALAAACTGRLTVDWRMEHASEAAVDFVNELVTLRKDRTGRKSKASSDIVGDEEIPDTWCWVSIGSLVDVATGATPLRRRSDYYGGGVPWVTSGAVNKGTIVEAAETITELALKETNAKLFPRGTLVVAMYGEGQTRGRVGELGMDAATNQALAALLFDENTESLRPYLRLYLLRNYERIRALSFGGVQPNLSLGVIRDTPVPLPPLLEQAEIVRRAMHLLDVGELLKGQIESASRKIELTANTFLHRALDGGLAA